MKRIILFIIAATMLLFGCKKYIDYSAIKFEITNEELVVTSTTATLTADYSWPWKVVSIAMEVSEDESLDNANSFEATVSGNSLTVTATGLKAGTTYYYRMRLNTENGKVESETKTLKTTAYILPTVTTSEVTNISGTKADCRCNVTSEGDFTVTARGVCWSTADNPTIDDSHTVDGGGAGAFTSNITGLTENTTYYVRSYATSSAGTVYGETKVFVTTEYILPTVTTSEVTNISGTKADCRCNVTSEGDFTVTARGVCWGTTDNPTIDDSHTVDGGGAGSFISNITGLTENTTYYVRAYATSSAGTAYGATRTFKTTEYILPTVTTSEVTNIGKKTAKCGGEVTEGDFTVTARGVCWSTADNPTLDDSHTVDGGGAGSFISNITGLTENTSYYVRAYATSSAGTAYGATRTFKTTEYIFPTVTTSEVDYISATTAKCGGEVTEGDFTVTARGVCWSTGDNPTIDDSHTVDGGGAGSFTSNITGLTENTTYYVRAYATSSAGTVYGETRTFVTTAYILPTVTTSDVNNITYTTAKCGGEVTEGDFTVTARGVCWSTGDNPTIDDSHTVDGGGAGSFTSNITGLTENTTYYVRAYATSSAGTVYGETRTFVTTAYILPTVTTSDVNNITYTTAKCGGEVTEGDYTVTARGVCWSTADNPTIDDSHTVDGGGAGSFISNITGLTENTTYYVRAYATSSAGTAYGATRTFKTTEYIFPTVTTSEVNNITSTTAKCGGEVTEGDFTVTARGVCWGTADNPTIDDSHTVDGGGAGAFISNITGLTGSTTYYVRAYATSSAGTAYGETRTFVTTAYILPTVTTSDVNNITYTTAKCGGEVTEGDFTVTARGVCWNTTDNPTIDDSHTVDGGGAGSFISNITGLTENTTYYVRAYATSSAGTAYGETRTFKPNLSLTVNGVSFDMVYVEGGTFDMGATTEQGSDAYDNEYPVHSVTLSDYYIGKYEVTQELWLAVMGSWPGTAPSNSYGVGANYPAYYISWNDCQEFVAELNRLTGRTFRLPTEAEWEYAARGGNQSSHYKYSGSGNIDDVAWYSGTSGGTTHPVGTKSPNELGIYDMSGNVWEWCSDWYGSYSAGSQTNPQGPSSGSRLVLRGGDWRNYARNCRVSFRGDVPANVDIGGGLRLVLVP